MASPETVRATAANAARDPQDAVQLGGERHFSSKFPNANQQARDLVAAVTRLRANTGMADAMRAALEKRGALMSTRKFLQRSRRAFAKSRCLSCGKPIIRIDIGRPPRFCSPACKQANYRAKGEFRDGSGADLPRVTKCARNPLNSLAEKGRKSGSSIPIDIVGGWFRGHLDPKLRRSILATGSANHCAGRRAPHRPTGAVMIGGHASRRKGDRAERALVRYLQDRGFAAERVPLSGAAGGSYCGDISIPVLGVNRTVEVKVRGDGFARLYDWLDGRDMLVIKADRREPLVVLSLKLAAEIAAAAEGMQP